jgi:hypothetical protein
MRWSSPSGSMGINGAQWSGTILISAVAGFGYSVYEAMVELTKQMDFYHRNWEEFAEPMVTTLTGPILVTILRLFLSPSFCLNSPC